MIQDFRLFSLFESLRYSIHLGKGNKCDSIQFWTRCSNLHAKWRQTHTHTHTQRESSSFAARSHGSLSHFLFPSHRVNILRCIVESLQLVSIARLNTVEVSYLSEIGVLFQFRVLDKYVKVDEMSWRFYQLPECFEFLQSIVVLALRPVPTFQQDSQTNHFRSHSYLFLFFPMDLDSSKPILRETSEEKIFR